MIKIHQNYSLKQFNSFRLDCQALLFIESDNSMELLNALNTNNFDHNNLLLLGTGSNILLATPVVETVIHPVNTDITIPEESRDSVLIKCGAGLGWDEFVEWTVRRGYGGLENLSLIPGSVGAAPIQNIGAYGTEAAVCVESVSVIDLSTSRQFKLSREECRFGYRNSLFKDPAHKSWLVWEVFFRLDKDPQANLTYEPLKQGFPSDHNPDIREVREAVIRIRRSKLPDPAKIGNAGSFFTNPVISAFQARLLRENYPDMPTYYHDPASVKIGAGWLIEKCGWKGFRDGQVGVYAKQALVLVNFGGASASEILGLADKIMESVKSTFGIKLEMEIRVI
ncbi:MAG: UDP-N-acetylmuramate dehydrogenase [Bacteroidia bacterium]|nr:UDP-N-acetylmuramate dehydrogenase [Bacteroidia bacterium]